MNKLIILLIILCAGIWVTSCDLFEPVKDNIYTEERIARDPAFAEGILMHGYRAIPAVYNFDETSTDDAVTNNLNSSYNRMATGGWSALYNPMNVWSESYSVISYMNKFLASIVDKEQWSWQSTKRDSLFRSRFKGEALAFRGYYHFILLVNHGGIDASGVLMGVPVIKEVLETSSAWKLKRATYQETVAAIMKDLDDAFQLLPYDYVDKGTDGDYNRVNGASEKGRISGKIVQALKARIALHVASPSFNKGNYNVALCEQAAKSAEDVIGATKLPAAGLLFFDADDDITNAEIIWRNDFSSITTWESGQYPPSLYGRGEVNPTQNLVDVFPMKSGIPIFPATVSTYNPQNPYLNRDPRLAQYIMYNGNRFLTRVVNTNKESVFDGLNNTTASTRTGYYLKKLLRPDVVLTTGATTARRHFKPHIRFTELYLIYAEAANEAWGPDGDPKGYGLTARAAMAEIRKRAGIDAADTYLASIATGDKVKMRGLIRDERRIELCFEGFRFWDIRRWGLPMDIIAKGVSIVNNVYSYIDVENRLYEPYMKFGPIPPNEILKVPDLSQNEGW